tara:strand:- start:1914 stop:2600 length:687 start_codon:yes stop_codon:yes gene_type:complete
MKNTLIGIILGIILGFIIYPLINTNTLIPDNNLDYLYKTDTIIKKIPFTVHDTLQYITPPRYITQYQDTGSYHTIIIEKVDSNILLKLHNLEDSIKIHENFLKKFPRSSKLLQLGLSKDSLSITTMDISSNVKTNNYPIDLEFYQYQYSNNLLRHDSLEVKPKNLQQNNNFNQSLLIGGSYSILKKTPLVHIEYPIIYRQVRLSLESTASVETTPKLNIYLKALFQIK